METRPTKELLQLTLDNIDKYLNKTECWGLCALAHKLCLIGIINTKEITVLQNYIDTHRPKNKRYYMHKISDNKEYYFYWKRCKIAPRKKWLKKHIQRLT